jgi:aryl-alcohol dehydrogenase-like predicted oxidoreductase
MTVTPEAIRAKVDERCQRLRTDKLDLLQFHWQFVSSNIPQECIRMINY